MPYAVSTYATIAPTTLAQLTDVIFYDQISVDINYLASPPSANYAANEGADITTSSTSFVDLLSGTVNSSWNEQITLDISSDVLAVLALNIGFSTAMLIYFDITVDGARVGGDDGIVFLAGTNTTEGARSLGLPIIIPSVAAGLRTFRVQWKVSTGTATMYAGAGTSGKDVHPRFAVRKI